MQTIKFDNTGYQPIFTLYRGGIKVIEDTDIITGKSIKRIVGDDKYNRKEWDSYDKIESGFIFTVNDIDRVCEFFGFDKDNHTIVYKNVDLNLCFTNSETFILYRKNVSPQPITQIFTKRTKTYKEFARFDTWFNLEKPNGKEFKFWKFKSKNDYIVGNLMISQLKNLIPELVYDNQNEEIRMQLNNVYENATFKCNILYNLGLIDLNSSWDFTQEYKDIITAKRKKYEERKRQAEFKRIERMRTPGYCCHCGAEHANWTYDPFDYEMNGVKNYMWLCSSCENDLVMSI